ncbi:WD domain-containing protein [Histoplasma capsulatum G186AR]|uniref:WD domain-containing protein n=2 Tax=Ajellomyces capsulatus TaxID=5037 RepID=C0NMI8_AJECG|nr:WD domain-containing protein [Histoplasma capsulatum G186AR]EEH07086.1 WD domain-containing protein [Histoplasma capsulatum G186AR]KAG5287792.1 WD40 repeat-containing protein [Histoplasma capsulatum]QSS70409.1 WD40 repeat-containing protein [Histoplasma capsulatum G186AR]
MAEPSQAFNGPRRQQTFPRQPEELHIPAASSSLASNGPRPGQNQFSSAPDYGAPSINIQPSQFSSHANNNTTSLPGALQPGSGNRPGLPNTTGPPAIQMLPHLATQPLSPNTPSKSGQQQAFSRSSPSTFDQPKFNQVGSTPDNGKYISPTTGTYATQTPQASSPYSPLGLADIRPHIDSAMSEDTSSTVTGGNNGDAPYSTNSNHIAPWAVYALDWCKWPPPPGGSSFGKIAIGSYLEDSHNYIQILSAQRASLDAPESPDGNPGLDFIKTAEATHSYPVTRILWEPPSSQKQSTDLLATSGDHLRLWSLPADSHSQSYLSNSINRSSKSRNQPIQKLSPLALLSNSKSPEHTAPITSLDWNVVSPSLIITSSIDTTCTIWDIPTLTAKTQLIAHDKEVYDVRFCANSVDVFVSCGADGSVRMFDLRSLEHSTIIYEPSEKNEKLTNPGNLTPPSHNAPWPPPLLRIAASPHDAHLLGTFSQDSNVIRILDVRQPGQALLELKGHAGPINCIEWSPTRRGTIASGADDSLVLIWDLINQSNAATVPPAPPPPNHSSTPNAPTTVERGPAAAWQCEYEVSNISWAPHASGGMAGAPGVGRDWVGVCGGRGLWGVSI